jgi:hypothetical protein
MGKSGGDRVHVQMSESTGINITVQLTALTHLKQHAIPRDHFERWSKDPPDRFRILEDP